MSNIGALGDRLMNSTSNFTNNRPMCFLSTVGAVRDVLIGLGFLFGLEEIRQTRLFQNYDDLIPGYSGMAVGILLFMVGLFVAVTAISDKTQWTKAGLNFQAYAWLFSTIMYALHGEFLLAAIFGVFFSIPAWYIGFCYKRKHMLDRAPPD